MLTEEPCRQIKGEPPRRWISDDYFDLIVWLDASAGFSGFQLCYDKPGNERAFTWTTKGGFSHAAVQSGDTSPLANCTPVLVEDGNFSADVIRREFMSRSLRIEPTVRHLVLEKIDEFQSRKGRREA